MKIRFHPFTSGTYVVDRGSMDNINWGTKYRHPNPMFVIEHPKGIVLFDTGNNHRGVDDQEKWFGKSMDPDKMFVPADECMPARLKSLGIAPKDVRYVVMSHLHIDHAGEMMTFPDAKFVARHSELSYAWWPAPHMRYTYVFNDLKDTRYFDYLELPDGSDFDLFGDGSMVLIHTPGHTPGHQSLILTLPDYDRPIILCQDACYTRFNLEGHPYSGGLMWNTEKWFHSIQRLQHFERIGHEIWFGHEMESWLENSKKFS